MSKQCDFICVVTDIQTAQKELEEKSRNLLKEVLDSVGGKYEWQDGYEPCVSATIGGILQYVNVKKIWVNDENIVMLNVLPSDDCMYYDIAVSKLEFGQTIEIADDMVRYAVED